MRKLLNIIKYNSIIEVIWVALSTYLQIADLVEIFYITLFSTSYYALEKLVFNGKFLCEWTGWSK